MFEIGVAYREHVDEATDEINHAAKELADDPEFKVIIIGNLETYSLNNFGDSAIVIKGRIKTKLSKQ